MKFVRTPLRFGAEKRREDGERERGMVEMSGRRERNGDTGEGVWVDVGKKAARECRESEEVAREKPRERCARRREESAG